MRTLVTVICTILLAGPAGAQNTGLNASPATIATIKATTLDASKATTIVKTMEEISAATMSHPESLQAVAASMKKPLEERIAMMDGDATVKKILQANNIGAKDYTVGLLALRAAIWAQGGQRGGLADLANPANVTMLNGNKALVDRFSKAEQGRFQSAPAPK